MKNISHRTSPVNARLWPKTAIGCFPNGFNIAWVTPVPDYYSRGERIVSQLQSIGIRSKLPVMERGVFLKRLQGGLKEWPGVQIIMNPARVGGTWSNCYDSFVKCGSFNGKDRNWVPELDDKFNKYLASTDRQERQDLATAIQREILENYYFVLVTSVRLKFNWLHCRPLAGLYSDPVSA